MRKPRTAALCHDYGKALTPARLLPSHYGHEQSGVGLVEAFCARLKVPSDCRDLALHVCREHLLVHQARDLLPTTLMQMLERLDVLRRPARFEEFLLACECDARGRTGLENRHYPQPDYLREALRLAEDVRIADRDHVHHVVVGLLGFAVAFLRASGLLHDDQTRICACGREQSPIFKRPGGQLLHFCPVRVQPITEALRFFVGAEKHALSGNRRTPRRRRRARRGRGCRPARRWWRWRSRVRFWRRIPKCRGCLCCQLVC